GYIGILTFLIYFVVGLSAALVIPAIQKSQGNPPMMMSIALVVIFYLPFIAMHLIFARRRFHDLDLSGWLSALVLIPLLNLLVWLYLIFAPGT
ncbi:DUF805 domain-containing protein, partial [Klebsiella pneumoniae]|uniref:DUF805 domain-containing protein n=1 Tax=Klebsiella pneumoniae TaxID=573 RepID=UPI003EE38464